MKKKCKLNSSLVEKLSEKFLQTEMLLWIAHTTLLINLIFAINCLNDAHQPQVNTTAQKRVSAKIYPSYGDFKIGVLVSVRLHSPGKKNTRNLECGKVR